MAQTETAPVETTVRAPLVYTINNGIRPSTGSTEHGEVPEWRRGDREAHEVTIRNGRPLANTFSIDVEGFEFIRHDTRMKDFYDIDELKSVYYRETEEIVKSVSGANRALIFDHTLRTGDEADRAAKKIREPVLAVHNDYTEWSGPQRVRDLLPADEAEYLLKYRVAVIQVWRAINTPIEEKPLAICDARTMSPEDFIAAERLHPGRRGEIYQVAYNPKQVWYYFPLMQRDEALVFKCYDSLKDGRARFTAHTAFADPTTRSDAPPRESIEMRALAFWAPPQ